MNPADALDIGQAAIWTVVVACSPAVIVAMLVGLVIALIQALTQVQEITLTFVPKILAILLVTSLTWCNDTPHRVMASIATDDGKAVTGRGWYRIEPGKCLHPDVMGQPRRIFSFAEATYSRIPNGF